MYAIIESGGKQHKVFEGDVLRLEKLNAAAGETVNFDKVLLVAGDDQVTLGAPYVENTQVTAEVVEQGRGEKIRIVKFRRRKHHQKQTGHRQYYTSVKITAIETGGKTATKSADTAGEQSTDSKPTAKAAAKKTTSSTAGKSTSTAKKPAAKAKTAAKKPAAKKSAGKSTTSKAATKKSAADKTEE